MLSFLSLCSFLSQFLKAEEAIPLLAYEYVSRQYKSDNTQTCAKHGRVIFSSPKTLVHFLCFDIRIYNSVKYSHHFVLPEIAFWETLSERFSI